MTGIPPHAKKVFEGKIYDVWQWEQQMYDGSIAVFEKLTRMDTVDVIAVTESKEIVIITQEQPDSPKAYRSLPGGRVEKDEDTLDAAKRELLEESGYVSDDWEHYCAVMPYSKVVYQLHTYIARNAKRVAEPTPDGGEKLHVSHVSVDEFIDMALDPEMRFHLKNTDLVRAKYEPAFGAEFKKRLGL